MEKNKELDDAIVKLERQEIKQLRSNFFGSILSAIISIPLCGLGILAVWMASSIGLEKELHLEDFLGLLRSLLARIPSTDVALSVSIGMIAVVAAFTIALSVAAISDPNLSRLVDDQIEVYRKHGLKFRITQIAKVVAVFSLFVALLAFGVAWLDFFRILRYLDELSVSEHLLSELLTTALALFLSLITVWLAGLTPSPPPEFFAHNLRIANEKNKAALLLRLQQLEEERNRLAISQALDNDS